MFGFFRKGRQEAHKGLWIDAPDFERRLEQKQLDPETQGHLRGFAAAGLIVLRNAAPAALCDEIVSDYQAWCGANAEYVKAWLDEQGREKRLVNFHLASSAARRLITNPRIIGLLETIFEHEASIYTSLTFKYGTQQPAHRDTPHFATWPRERFVGVWTALEPVDADAGPLFYHPGAHKLNIDQTPFWEQAQRQQPEATREEQLYLALDLYNGKVIREVTRFCDPVPLVLNKGDTVIWHPQLPHGGSPAADPARTRWSMVFHCAPSNIQVFQHDKFFLHRDSAAPAPRYRIEQMDGHLFARAGDTAFM